MYEKISHPIPQRLTKKLKKKYVALLFIPAYMASEVSYSGIDSVVGNELSSTISNCKQGS